ncbi:MAG: hypothetical protein IJ745_00330 [Bacteroidales bacterium]|nr:hypothetical protein [Bacteroidales bacterium]
MNKTFRTIALIAVLGTMAVGCQKEQPIELQSSITEIGTVYTVQYSVNGVLHQETLVGEQAWSGFLHCMLALAEEGYEVSVANENISSRAVATKEVVTYSSSSQEDAYSWCDKMVLSGYTVTITYDKEKKVYNCIAIK